ncbi:MAG: hypothetical protein M3Z27_05085 [Actinomycetota bacterium]|nr:hypothetical protein [Actinomycetota bacterium]
MRRLKTVSRLALLGAALVAVIAGVHFQQHVDFISEVPTVGVLFLLNAAGGAGLALALLSSDRVLRLLAAVGSIGLAAGSLISIFIALQGSFFGYREPTLRLPIVIAILAEAAAIPVLVALLRQHLGPASRRGAPAGRAAS